MNPSPCQQNLCEIVINFSPVSTTLSCRVVKTSTPFFYFLAICSCISSKTYAVTASGELTLLCHSCRRHCPFMLNLLLSKYLLPLVSCEPLPMLLTLLLLASQLLLVAELLLASLLKLNPSTLLTSSMLLLDVLLLTFPLMP